LEDKGSKTVDEFILEQRNTLVYCWSIRNGNTGKRNYILSTPGQAYHDGMFIQFYFGLIAMVVICLTFIPIYHKYKVYTAYENLEKDLI
jgi:Na+/proline symporter